MLVVVLCLSFLGKALFRLWFSDPATYWKSGYSMYHRMAVGLLETGYFSYGGGKGGAYPCFRLPGYPAFMAAVCWLANDSARIFIVCQALVSTVTVGLVYWITSQYASKSAALMSALLFAVFPYAFVHDTQQQENGLYNAISTLSIALFLFGLPKLHVSRWMLVAGILTGFAVLTRGSHLFPAMVLPVGLWLTSTRTRSEIAVMSTWLLLGMSIVVVPWMVRNYSVSGRFSLSSQAGFSLGVAHNPSTFDYFPYRGSIDQSWRAYLEKVPAEFRPQLGEIVRDEFKASDFYRQEGITYVQDHPLETLRRGVVKVFVTFAGVLSPLADPVKNWMYFVSFWGLTGLAVLGLQPLRGTPFWAVFWGFMAAQAAFSFVYYAHTSHRSYLDPLLAVPAGPGLVRLWIWLRAPNSASALAGVDSRSA